MGEWELVAYFTSGVDPAPTVSAFRRFLKQKLPAHMIPSLYVPLGAMPLTPNGKINRAALPVPDRSASESESLHPLPQNPIEAKLLEIWMRVLRVRPIGTSDDFFDLGGDSLAAVELIAAVEKEFGINLAPGTLVEAFSVGRLARHIAAEQDRTQVRRGNLLQLQRGTARTPIFFVPGGVGGVAEFFVYTRLARHVGTKFPFYGLKARSADGTESAQSTVEQMASDYIGAMQSVQPRGPYYIIGECAGGIVAYEIAQQLHERGQHIALLILMDTARPDWSLEARRKVRRIIEPLLRSHRFNGLTFLWDQLRRRTGLDKARYLVSKSGIIARETFRRERTTSSQPVDRAIEYVQRSYSRAIYAYRPKPYPGTMTLLVHDEFRKDDERVMLGWIDFVADIELHVLPGSHLTYIRDHVDAVAARIRECVERADAADMSPASSSS